MLQAALRDGTADRRCVFELFARRLPEGRRYGVVAGTGRLLDALPHFRFDDEQLAELRARRVIDDDDLPTGWPTTASPATSTGYPEGELFLPGSPVLTVEGTFAEAVLLETLVLSHPQPRQRGRLGGRPDGRTPPATGRCIEMGSRRTHEEAAVAAARAAYLAGFAATSNLEAGRRYGVPTGGHRGARVHPAARHRGRRVPRAGRRPSASAPRCWSTPTTSRPASRPRSRWPGPTSAPCASTPATSAVLAHQARELLDALGAPRDPHRAVRRPRRVRHRRAAPPRRSTPTASAPRW